jgi:DNA polymerase III sliding clamp (beta) subunit (PCNA family)
MLDALRFVSGSVAKKDLLPALTHFVIENGTVRGYDGTLALCSPINLDISCKPKGDTMVRAIAACGDNAISLTMTAAGRLSIKAGANRFLVDCYPEQQTPHTLPEGDIFPIDGKAFLEACESLLPLIGNDASRPWSNGLLIDGSSIYATNNVILAQVWTGMQFPHRICVPGKAIKEIVRVKQAPSRIQLAATAVTFHYEDKRWIRTQLLDAGAWPDLGKVLDKPAVNPPVELNVRLFDALRTIKPFANKLQQAFIGDGAIRTSLSDEEGATVEFPDMQHTGIYGVDMLQLLEGIAVKIDWTAYPRPCLWFGNKIRGAIVGQRSL